MTNDDTTTGRAARELDETMAELSLALARARSAALVSLRAHVATMCDDARRVEYLAQEVAQNRAAWSGGPLGSVNNLRESIVRDAAVMLLGETVRAVRRATCNG